MARKKRVKRASVSKVVPTANKVHLALKNMISFGLIFAISLGIYNWVENELIVNVFWVISIITGFIAVAFLVAYLVLVFMKWFKK